MGVLRQVHPMDVKLIKHIYGVISSLDRKEYKDLTFDKFLECRDNIYIFVDNCYDFDIGEYPSIDGVIACRRTDMDINNINDLPYYCQSNEVMYVIEALYVFQCENIEKFKNIVNALIKVNCIDKNDAFMSVRISTEDEHITNVLLDNDFYINSYDKGIYTYIKFPITKLNRND